MSSQVKYNGEEVDLQIAFDAMSVKMKNLQETLDESLAQASTSGLNKSLGPGGMDITLGTATALQTQRPYFDLVSSIPSYSGDRADLVIPFFEHIDGIGELSGWTDSQKLQIVKIKLTGEALQFAKCDERCRTATTTQEIKEAIIERFGDSLPDHYYFEQLASIRQNKGETIEQFADRVKRTCDKTIRSTSNEEVNKALREEGDRRAMEAFIRGLHGEVGKQTRIKFPKTYKEAVATAIALRNLEIKPEINDIRPKKIFSAKPTGCFICGRNGHRARDCRTSREDTICNFCKRRGHSEEVCRDRTSRPYCDNCRNVGHLTENCWGTRRGRSNFNPRGRGGLRGRSGNQTRGHLNYHPNQQGNSNGVTMNAAGSPNQ